MSDNRQLLTDMAAGLFAELEGAEFATAWPRLAETGFATLLVPEEQGGFGGDWGDLYAVLKLAGQHALPSVLGDTIIAHKILADAGVAAPEGAIGLLDGDRVAFGRHCGAVLGPGKLLPGAICDWHEGTSADGKARDRLGGIEGFEIAVSTNADLKAKGAFVRVAMAAGALEAGFALAIEHVNTRVQFGKPLGKFQAVQQALAEASSEIAAVLAAGQAAAAAFQAGDSSFEVAAAKYRMNRAVDVAVPILHRVHGAIGFTMEYPLNRFTRALMGWRSEFGNDAFWARWLGERVAKGGGKALWREVTARGDRQSR